MAVQGGQRPDYKERLAQKKRSGMIKLFLYAAMIGGGIGFAFLKRAEIKKFYDDMTAGKPVKAPVTVTEKGNDAAKAPEVKPQDERKKIEPPPEPPKVVKAIDKAPVPDADPKDVATARKALTEGKALFEQFQFVEAAKVLDGAAKLKIGALADDVQLMKKKAVEFGNATKHVTIADFAQGDTAVLVTTIDGNEWRGLKTRETDEHVYLQAVSEDNPASEGKQIFPIAKNEIKSTAPLPLKQRQAAFAELLAGMEGATNVTHSSELYDLVYMSKRLGMGRECVEYLSRAYDGRKDLPGDAQLGDSFRKVVMNRAISRASLLMAANRRTQVELELKKLQTTLAGYGPAEEEIAAFRSQVLNKVRADFQSSIVLNERKPEMSRPERAPREKTEKKMPVREEEIEVSVDNSRIVGNGKAAAIVEKANAKFEQGASTFRLYKVGVAGNKFENNRNLLAAKALLNEAIDMYEEALKFDSGNKAIRDRQQSAGMMVYSCNKNLIL